MVSCLHPQHSVATSVTTYAETVIYYKYFDPARKFVGKLKHVNFKQYES